MAVEYLVTLYKNGYNLNIIIKQFYGSKLLLEHDVLSVFKHHT